MITAGKSPGQAAYEAWSNSLGQSDTLPSFSQLRDQDRRRWDAVADAAIGQVKSIIAEELVTAAAAVQRMNKWD